MLSLHQPELILIRRKSTYHGPALLAADHFRPFALFGGEVVGVLDGAELELGGVGEGSGGAAA